MKRGFGLLLGLVLLSGCGGMPTEPTQRDLYKHYIANFMVTAISPGQDALVTPPVEVAIQSQFDVVTPPFVVAFVFVRDDNGTFIVRADAVDKSLTGQPRVPLVIDGMVGGDTSKDIFYAFAKDHTLDAAVLIFKGNGYPLNSGLDPTAKLDTALLVEQYPIKLGWRFQ